MCLIAFALGQHPQCPLLLASNRDEFWQRPTLPLAQWQWPGGGVVLSGRDGLAGGAWLGVTPAGRVAMLTNVRTGVADEAPRSRGELVTRWLAGPSVTPDWQHLVQATQPEQYGGFNLVLGSLSETADGKDWVWLSNRPAVAAPAPRHPVPLSLPPGWVGCTLSTGVYGLSNAGLDTPWPKTLLLKHALQRSVSHWGSHPTGAWHAPVLDALLDMRWAAPHTLPHTGMSPDWERRLSSPFVHMPDMAYGTRSSLLLRCLGGQWELDEWTHPTSAHGLAPEYTHWPLHLSQHTALRHPLQPQHP